MPMQNGELESLRGILVLARRSEEWPDDEPTYSPTDWGFLDRAEGQLINFGRERHPDLIREIGNIQASPIGQTYTEDEDRRRIARFLGNWAATIDAAEERREIFGHAETILTEQFDRDQNNTEIASALADVYIQWLGTGDVPPDAANFSAVLEYLENPQGKAEELQTALGIASGRLAAPAPIAVAASALTERRQGADSAKRSSLPISLPDLERLRSILSAVISDPTARYATGRPASDIEFLDKLFSFLDGREGTMKLARELHEAILAVATDRSRASNKVSHLALGRFMTDFAEVIGDIVTQQDIFGIAESLYLNSLRFRGDDIDLNIGRTDMHARWHVSGTRNSTIPLSDLQRRLQMLADDEPAFGDVRGRLEAKIAEISKLITGEPGGAARPMALSAEALGQLRPIVQMLLPSGWKSSTPALQATDTVFLRRLIDFLEEHPPIPDALEASLRNLVQSSQGRDSDIAAVTFLVHLADAIPDNGMKGISYGVADSVVKRLMGAQDAYRDSRIALATADLNISWHVSGVARIQETPFNSLIGMLRAAAGSDRSGVHRAALIKRAAMLQSLASAALAESSREHGWNPQTAVRNDPATRRARADNLASRRRPGS